MKTSLFFFIVGAFFIELSAQGIQPLNNIAAEPTPSGYAIVYKGLTCVSNNGRKRGSDLKVFFLGISENMRPNEMASTPFDSLLYEGVKTGGSYNAPVLTIFEGKCTEGVTLLCYVKEVATERSKLKRKRLINWLEALNGVRFTVSRGRSPVGTQDVGYLGTPNEEQLGGKAWRTQITANVMLNPMGIFSRLISMKTDHLVEKKYHFISTKELAARFKTTPELQSRKGEDLTLVFENGKSKYLLHFEISARGYPPVPAQTDSLLPNDCFIGKN